MKYMVIVLSPCFVAVCFSYSRLPSSNLLMNHITFSHQDQQNYPITSCLQTYLHCFRSAHSHFRSLPALTPVAFSNV
jgi:hypothetical protein